LRIQSGIYLKEQPETIGDDVTKQSDDTKISTMGPHLGAEYWHSLTPKLGVQANLHLYYSALKMATPNGQGIDPTISTQIGFLGSYRLTSILTGLVGYAHREENMAYKCKNTTYCTSSDRNKSTIKGDFLNLFAEWSF
jgi:hypothetical protein